MPFRWIAALFAAALLCGFGTGERVVGEPYTQEMFEKTHRWMEELKIFPEAQSGSAGYRESILV